MASYPLQGRKRIWVFALVGVALLLAGSVFGVDWTNYFLGTHALYPAIGKPLITLLAMALVLSIGRERLSPRDWALLLAAFCCMLPTDILMSIVAVNPNVGVGSAVFMAGGVLSILAHLFLILRLIGHGAPGWRRRDNVWKNLWLPLLIFGIAATLLLLLWREIVRVGHAAIAPVYTAFAPPPLRSSAPPLTPSARNSLHRLGSGGSDQSGPSRNWANGIATN